MLTWSDTNVAATVCIISAESEIYIAIELDRILRQKSEMIPAVTAEGVQLTSTRGIGGNRKEHAETICSTLRYPKHCVRRKRYKCMPERWSALHSGCALLAEARASLLFPPFSFCFRMDRASEVKAKNESRLGQAASPV